MEPAEFGPFLENLIRDYARDNVRASRWSEPSSLRQARSEVLKLLPDGLATPRHHLFTIRAEPSGEAVGQLWYALEEEDGAKSPWVYDLRIFEAHRRKGYASAALAELHRRLSDAGVERVGLHVFGFNAPAIELYRGLGYEVSGLLMAKEFKGKRTETPP